MLAAVALAGELARSAAAFADSVGVNVHLEYRDTAYYQRFGEIERLLAALGVRHVRDGMVLGQRDVCARDRDLASRGVRVDFITQPERTQQELVEWAGCVGPAIEAYEGPNEYDISHPASDADWAGTLRRFQPVLFHAVRAEATLRGLRVVGPSVTSPGAARAVGDLSADLDVGNTHDYFAAHEPETPGWGADGYGSLAYNLALARTVSGSKPVVATETGYETGGAHDPVSEDVAAAYLPRLLLTSFAAGLPRTYLYELVDEGPPDYAHLGLIRGDLTPKPAFTVVARLLHVLGDGATATSAPGRLAFALRDASPHVRHLLFQRSRGHFVLALWTDRSLVVPKIGLALPPDDEHVTLALPAHAVARTAVRLDGGAGAPAPLPSSGAIDVTPSVTLVEIETR